MFRIGLYIVIASTLVSCDYIFRINHDSTKHLDTIIDFSRVDVSPSFKECEGFIDEQRTICFREKMNQKVTRYLSSYTDTVSTTIDEHIVLVLEVSKSGKVSIVGCEKDESFKKNLPNFMDDLNEVVNKLPNLSPALKRGIPVKAQYTLPIHVKTN